MYVPDLARMTDVSTALAGAFVGSAETIGGSLGRHQEYAATTSNASASVASATMIQPRSREDVAIATLRTAV
jgi:hypothetical protein